MSFRIFLDIDILLGVIMKTTKGGILVSRTMFCMFPTGVCHYGRNGFSKT